MICLDDFDNEVTLNGGERCGGASVTILRQCGQIFHTFCIRILYLSWHLNFPICCFISLTSDLIDLISNMIWKKQQFYLIVICLDSFDVGQEL